MANNYTDTNISNMIFNILSSAKYQELLTDNELNNNQLYFITDDNKSLTFTQNNSTIATFNNTDNVTIDLTTVPQAIADDTGQTITSTYIKNASISGNIITYTRGDDTTATLTLPSLSDTKVTQTAVTSSSYTNWRPLIWGASNSATEGFNPATTTDGVFTTQTLSVQPSSGTIKASIFKGDLNGNADTASRAAADGSGQIITTTYIKGLSINNSTITYTKGNDTTDSFNVPDTKNTAGSTQDANKLFLIGAKSQAANPQTYSSSKVYVTDGTITASTFSGDLNGNATTATTATKDASGNVISAYIKNIEKVTGTALSFKCTKGDDTNFTVTLEAPAADTTVATYSVLGKIKPWFSTTGASSLKTGSASSYTNTPSINARTTTDGKYYAIEIDKNGRLFVNVPWSDTDTITSWSGGNGTAPSWSFENITVPIQADSDTTVPKAATSATACDDITAWSAGSGSFTQGTFNGGSGSFTQGAFNGGSLTMTMDTTDSKQLNITFTAATHGADSHTHTPATHGADSHSHTAPSLSYTARSITGVSGSVTVRGVKTGTNSTTTASHVTGGSNGSASTWSFSNS